MRRLLSNDTDRALPPDLGGMNRSLFACKFGMALAAKPDGTVETRDRGRVVDKICTSHADETGRMSRLSFLESLPDERSRSFTAELRGRLIVDQAGGVFENMGLCLDRNLGIPFVPGSALKGVARSYALDQVETDEPARRLFLGVFGWAANDPMFRELNRDEESRTSSFAGLISFLPAFPADTAHLVPDIVTCHHTRYYSGKEQTALDTESPIPNLFPTVDAGCRFRFTIVSSMSGERREWLQPRLGLPADASLLETAQEWLIGAVCDRGVGAKTAAGYGWFFFDRKAEERAQREREAAEQREAAAREEKQRETKRLASLSPLERAREQISALDNTGFAHFARDLENKESAEQKAFLQVLTTERPKRIKMWRKKKPGLFAVILKVAEKHGEELE